MPQFYNIFVEIFTIVKGESKIGLYNSGMNFFKIPGYRI